MAALGTGATVDLVIRGARIVDGTGRAEFVGDVAVSDGLIVRVGGTWPA